MMDELIVGIDLGTTNSAIAVWDTEKKVPIALPNREGSELTPSAVTFDPELGTPIVGQPAVDMMLTHPEDVVYSVKRFIGLSYQDEQVRLSREQVTYRIEGTRDYKVVIRAAERTLTPPQISKHVLEKLREDAKVHLKRPVAKAVITVPAYFSESQRHATMDAGRRAGLDVRRLVNEPTAAALAFELDSAPQNVVVYDLGGGTFDVSIIQIKQGMYRVVATSGDNHLGGDDFDREIANWVRKQFRTHHEIPLIADPLQDALLRERSEQAKIALSEENRTSITLKGLRAVGGSTFDFQVELDRETFGTLVKPLIDRTLQICEKVLAMAHRKTGLQASDISQVLLVGGQTLTPAVRSALLDKYGWPLNNSVDPGLAVGLGAAKLGGYLGGDDFLKKRIRLWDVIAQPLGIEVKEGTLSGGRTMQEIIQANQQIPITTQATPIEYTNDLDGQSEIRFHVYQGSDPIAKKNIHLGTVPLPLANPRAKGEARVKCWFDIDWDGILEVHAKELDTNSEEVVKTIDYFYYLSQEEADKLE